MLLNQIARRFRHGSLHLHWPDGTTRALGEGEPEAHIRLNRKGALRRILRNPYMQLGESYMDGDWDPEGGELLPVFEVLVRNFGADGPQSPFGRALDAVRRAWRETDWVSRARRNVSHHYDLDESLFRRFLDEDMQYSCAYFPGPKMSLDEAQLAKRRHIGRKLVPSPGARILDIGCGWGGMALYLAEEYGARVTGLTLSEEQVRVARKRAQERGLEDRVEFRLEDYRQHTGAYEGIVSVGMFEHVGRPQYPAFFDSARRLLKPDGVALLHTIGRTGPPTVTDPWINRYIFPGGYIPALSEVSPHVERYGLVLSDLEVLRLHYAMTLQRWHQRFQKARSDIAERMGERFCRMWEFYLQASESAFRWGQLVVFQFQLAHRNAAVPITRDYLYGTDPRLLTTDEISLINTSHKTG